MYHRSRLPQCRLVTRLDLDHLQHLHKPFLLAAKAQMMLFTDVRQNHHVIALPLTKRTIVPGTITTRCNIQNMAKPIHRHMLSVFFDKRKSHLL